MTTVGGGARHIRRAIEIGDPRELRMSLGLSPETPFTVIKGLLNWLSRQQAATPQEVERQASELRLRDWLESGASLNTLVSSVRQLVSSGLLPAALALL
jgi:hypothetical protein